MKKLILTIAALAGVSYGAFAQGTISFQNFNPAGLGTVWSNAPGVTVTNGGTLAATGFHVELLYGALGSGVTSNSGVIFTSATGGGQFFDGTTITLAGVTAGTGNADANGVDLAVRGWIGAFADYASAVAGGAPVGETAAFSNPTGGAGTALPAGLVKWLPANSLVLTSNVPEPTTIALGGLGIASLLLFRRRK